MNECLPIDFRRAFDLTRYPTLHEQMVIACKTIVVQHHHYLFHHLLDCREIYDKYAPLTDYEVVDIVGTLYDGMSERGINPKSLFEDEVLNWVLLERGIEVQEIYQRYGIHSPSVFKSISDKLRLFDNYDSKDTLKKIPPSLRRMLLMYLKGVCQGDGTEWQRVARAFDLNWI